MMRTFTHFCFVVGLIGSFMMHFVYSTDSALDKSRTPLQASFVQAKNQSVAKASSVVDDDDFLGFDLSQDDPDLIHLAGLDILAESQQLSIKMQHLSNEELRVTSLQVGLKLHIMCNTGKPCVQYVDFVCIKYLILVYCLLSFRFVLF